LLTNGDPFDDKVRIERAEDEPCEVEVLAVKEECSRKDESSEPEDRRVELILGGAEGTKRVRLWLRGWKGRQVLVKGCERVYIGVEKERGRGREGSS